MAEEQNNQAANGAQAGQPQFSKTTGLGAAVMAKTRVEKIGKGYCVPVGRQQGPQFTGRAAACHARFPPTLVYTRELSASRKPVQCSFSNI